MTRCVAFLLATCLAIPARADCTNVSVAEGEVLTPEAAECLRSEVVRLVKERDDAQARLLEARTATQACEATAAITCPPEPLPVVPVAIAAVLGVVAGAVAVIALFFVAR